VDNIYIKYFFHYNPNGQLFGYLVLKYTKVHFRRPVELMP